MIAFVYIETCCVQNMSNWSTDLTRVEPYEIYQYFRISIAYRINCKEILYVKKNYCALICHSL